MCIHLNNCNMQLGKYSFGTGDRFARQGEAQLKAFIEARKNGLEITPVWNKSGREHNIISSHPADTRQAADTAIKNLNWNNPWFVDADHINMSNVDMFIDSSDFFTIDVAEYIGKEPPERELDDFVRNNMDFTGEFMIPRIESPFILSEKMLLDIGKKFLFAIKEAGKIYRHIESRKGKGNFITEISMDEVVRSQSPIELFFILNAISNEKIPVQTIAPKFSGRFNKGVDYEGDLKQFAVEFEQDLLVIDLAIKEFGLPENLKLSVHSGSDKFSIYPLIGELIRKYDKGIHIKTAGTTWLEEMIGLAMAGSEAFGMVVKIYGESLLRFDELCGPYSAVIDIDRERLPTASEVSGWDGKHFASALRHDPGNRQYNPDMRQLIHVAYKIAAEQQGAYTSLLDKNREIIGRQVTENIYERHFKKLFDILNKK
ncbi:MAG: tagaturonate epimerase family protein [Bacteroidales bacterium]